MRYSKYFILLLPLYATLSYVRCTPEVNTSTALVRGSEIKYGEKTVKQFLGIQFAEPPVGALRFKKPVPLQGWSGKLNAFHTPPACVQNYPFGYDVIDKLLGKSEDCLYLSIWVPGDACPLNPRAVILYLFAGSFTTGSNRLPIYNGTVLAAKGDVIVVVPNYRLGIFGFLSTDSEKAPGNMGLYDVLEALKWVNSNIEAFGGDKNRITIAGNSAGSIISAFFTISPLTKGLFQRVIMESGADITVRAGVKQYNLRLGQQVATIVKCASDSKTLQNNTDEVIECLKKKTADELVTAVNSIMKTSLISFLPIYNDQFLPETPSKAYENGKFHDVCVLIGDTQDEGTFQLVSDNADVFGPYGEKDPTVNKTYGSQLVDKVLRSDNIDSNGRSKIIDYYLSSVSDNDYYGIRRQVGRALGDVNVFCNNYYYASQFSKKGDVYFSYFDHRTQSSIFANYTGVTLFTEIYYVFGNPINDPKFTKEEAELSDKILHLWSNFVKDGVPSSTWKRFDASDPHPYVEPLQLKGDVNDIPQKRFNNCNCLKPYYGKYGKA